MITEKTETIAYSLVANGFGVKMKTGDVFDISNPNWPLAWYVVYGSLCGYLPTVSGDHLETEIMSSCEIADAIRLTDEQNSVKVGEQQ